MRINKKDIQMKKKEEIAKVKDFRIRKSCPRCRSYKSISNHYGKFKCHECNYMAFYDNKGREEVGKIVWW